MKKQHALFFFSLLLSSLSFSQQYSLKKVYDSLTQKKTYSLPEQEQLVDSLRKAPEILVDPEILANIYYNEFLVGYNKKKDFEKMIVYMRKIQEIGEVEKLTHKEFFQKNYRNKLLYCSRIGSYYEAIEAAENYLQLYSKKDIDLGRVYRLLGSVYRDVGDYQKGLDNYEKARTILSNFSKGKSI